jgi:hypothetical protein
MRDINLSIVSAEPTTASPSRGRRVRADDRRRDRAVAGVFNWLAVLE